ncbi:MAG: hypothetical protein DRJ52_05085, partial [Thermoprotei archaeon]
FEAWRDGVRLAQVNKLLEMLESLQDTDRLLVFLAYQVARGQWGRGASARRLYDLLKDYKSIEKVREILTLFKWLYEICSRRRPRVRPPSLKPEGFLKELLKSAL